jgi:hypothetical protein
LTDVVTFGFHYPRLQVMFKEPMPAEAEGLRQAAREWAIGNVGRAVMLVVALLAAVQATVALAHA